MRVEIDSKGVMMIIAETPLEKYALKCWLENNHSEEKGFQSANLLMQA